MSTAGSTSARSAARSSRGGRKALAAMIADLAEHPFAVHVVDGPRGPRGVIKAGLISMAQLSGVPIVPVAISVTRAWVLKSWDRFLIPKPFSTVFVRWGAPIAVPASLDDTAFETTPPGGGNKHARRCRTTPTGNAAGRNPSSETPHRTRSKHSRTSIFHGTLEYPLFNRTHGQRMIIVQSGLFYSSSMKSG